MDKPYLFKTTLDVPQDITSHLNLEKISDRLRDVYEKKGYPLSEDKNISVKVVKRSNEWDIYDEIKGYQHRIIKENESSLYILDIQKEDDSSLSYLQYPDKQKEKSDMNKPYLFTIEGNIEDITRNLNDGNIPKSFKEGFKKKGYEFSDDEDISLIIYPDRWELYDQINGQEFEIKKEDGKLNVYKVEKSRKPQEEIRKAEEETGEESEWFNKLRTFSLRKNIGLGLLLYLFTCLFIGAGMYSFDPPIIFILFPLMLLLGVISLVVGAILGLSSKEEGDAFLSGSLTSFLGTIIVVLILISAGAMELQEESIGNDGTEGEQAKDEVCGRFFIFAIMMGVVGGVSGLITNSFVCKGEAIS